MFYLQFDEHKIKKARRICLWNTLNMQLFCKFFYFLIQIYFEILQNLSKCVLFSKDLGIKVDLN